MSDQPDFFAAVGKLVSFRELDVDAMRFVYRVERVGETFYERLAERVGNAEAAELLRKNAREERGHAERLRRALALKLGRDWQPAAEDFAPYAIPLPDAIGPDLLAGIVAGELSGDASYQEWADRESDPEIQTLLRQNGREEIVHSKRVEAVLEILRR
jgi:rubrerythrin